MRRGVSSKWQNSPPSHRHREVTKDIFTMPPSAATLLTLWAVLLWRKPACLWIQKQANLRCIKCTSWTRTRQRQCPLCLSGQEFTSLWFPLFASLAANMSGNCLTFKSAPVSYKHVKKGETPKPRTPNAFSLKRYTSLHQITACLVYWKKEKEKELDESWGLGRWWINEDYLAISSFGVFFPINIPNFPSVTGGGIMMK